MYQSNERIKPEYGKKSYTIYRNDIQKEQELIFKKRKKEWYKPILYASLLSEAADSLINRWINDFFEKKTFSEPDKIFICKNVLVTYMGENSISFSFVYCWYNLESHFWLPDRDFNLSNQFPFNIDHFPEERCFVSFRSTTYKLGFFDIPTSGVVQENRVVLISCERNNEILEYVKFNTNDKNYSELFKQIKGASINSEVNVFINNQKFKIKILEIYKKENEFITDENFRKKFLPYVKTLGFALALMDRVHKSREFYSYYTHLNWKVLTYITGRYGKYEFDFDQKIFSEKIEQIKSEIQQELDKIEKNNNELCSECVYENSRSYKEAKRELENELRQAPKIARFNLKYQYIRKFLIQKLGLSLTFKEEQNFLKEHNFFKEEYKLEIFSLRGLDLKKYLEDIKLGLYFAKYFEDFYKEEDFYENEKKFKFW